MNNVFNIKKLRETNCLLIKESFTFSLEPKEGVNVDISKKQDFLISKYNKY